MRAFILAAFAVAGVACGNGMVQIESIVPVEGPVGPDAFVDVPLDSSEMAQNIVMPLDAMTPSFEVDTSKGYCRTGAGEDAECSAEPYGAHYAVVTIANHNEDSRTTTADDDPLEVRGGLIGIAQLDRYTAAFSALDNGPDIAPNGISGLLGVSIAPQRRKTFPVVLLGLDGKAEFRNSGESIPHRYAVKLTFEGPGGLVVEGGATVLLGDFSHCPEEYTSVPFCSDF